MQCEEPSFVPFPLSSIFFLFFFSSSSLRFLFLPSNIFFLHPTLSLYLFNQALIANKKNIPNKNIVHQIYNSAGNPACYFATNRPAGHSGRPSSSSTSSNIRLVVVVVVVVIVTISSTAGRRLAPRSAGRLVMAAGPAMY